MQTAYKKLTETKIEKLKKTLDQAEIAELRKENTRIVAQN